jgi:hypothetical protein
LPLTTTEAGTGAILISGVSALKFGEEVVDQSDERTVITIYTPLGVVAAIVPWNFPIQTLIGKIVPALLTGNTIIGYLLIYHRFLTELPKYHHFHRLFTNIPLFFLCSGILVI